MTPRFLVLYGTTDGQTGKIARSIGDTLRSAGYGVDVANARRREDRVPADAYDAVIVAASVHAGRYQRSVRRWVSANRAALAARPTAFVSVCLAVLQHEPAVKRELDQILERFFGATGWRPTQVKVVAGALPFTQFGWLKRRVMRQMASRVDPAIDPTRDYEYTDWNDVRAFALEFARLLPDTRGVPMAG